MAGRSLSVAWCFDSIIQAGRPAAYVRLIRRFKPERFPEQFKRLREAYEWIVAVLDAGANAQAAENSDDGPPKESFRPWPKSEIQRRLGHVRNSELEEYWNLAVQGEVGKAYRQIRQLSARRNNQMELKLRLYWLLVLYPELDSERTACDYLLEGLRQNPRHWPFLSMYCRHLEFDRKEFTSSRCGKLVRLEMPEEMLQELLVHRWTVAERLQLESKRCTRHGGDPRPDYPEG
ncbi:MAG: hypothetical protein U1D30_18735 [Planctomycetota bacterium]